MRYKGEAGPPPQLIRLAPGVGEGSEGGGGGGDGGGSKRLVAEVAPGEEGGEKGEEEPAFALLASKRQARQQASAAGVASAAPKQQQLQQQQQQAPAAAEGVQQASSGAAPAAGQATAAAATTVASGAADQRHQLQAQVGYEGKPATAVRITVPLPPGAAATARQHPRSVQASVCAECITLAVPGCQPLEVHLPFAVSSEGGSAELHATAAASSSGSGTCLVLRLPYRPIDSMLKELREAAAAAEGDGGDRLTGLD
jgi:hypothetical protein